MGLLAYFVPTKADKNQHKSTRESSKSNVGTRYFTTGLSPSDGRPTKTSLWSKSSALAPRSASPLVPFGKETRVRASTPSTTCSQSSGEVQNGHFDELNDIKCDVMVNYIYKQQRERLWTALTEDEGVVLKKTRGKYACCPPELANVPNGFMECVSLLNVRVAMTINTKVIKLFLHGNDTAFIRLSDQLHVQVLPHITHLPKCQKHQFAAFIADTGILVVWHDDPRRLLDHASRIERRLLETTWRDDGKQTRGAGAGEEDNSDSGTRVEAQAIEQEMHDPEKALDCEHRPLMLRQALATAVTLALTITSIFQGAAHVAKEVKIDGSYVRLALLTVMPLQLWLALFFFQALVGNVMQIIGPVSQMRKNSKFFSSVPPSRISQWRHSLPHVTVQLPVYQESLSAVIQPTVFSLKAAISTYEMQGGSANVFVNDDGMQLIEENLANERREFYEEHNIGWVARPRHNPATTNDAQPFHRRGKFKKASNLNYGLWISNRVEERLVSTVRHEKWTQRDEERAYKEALDQVISEDAGKTWAEGNIRIGDYILLVDSDTRVPQDCLLDAVSEMEQAPEVAIIQYASGVMNVTLSFFERGITFFTNLIYTAISFAVANGDIAPFVGHNAMMRWSALQSVAYDCAVDKRQKFWSEETVSEDFDMALRLQTDGYIVRLAVYTGAGFKEGVSLTVYDELARWEKYAYGCSELIFHPFKDWPRCGPLTPLFRRFVASNSIPLPSKCTIMAYVGTYFALASAWILTLANYFIVGWYVGYQDRYYISSFQIYIGLVTVFTLVSNLALAVLRYRTRESALLPALLTNFSWMPLLTLYLCGISLHLSKAILCHLCSVDVAWGATAKEVQQTTFFDEMPRVLRRFRATFAACALVAALMVYLARWAPPLWRIDFLSPVWPLALVVAGHFLLPLVLNPRLMLFTW